MRCYIAQQLHTKWRIALIDKLTLAVFRKLIKARLSGPIAYGRCFGGIIVRPDAKKRLIYESEHNGKSPS